MSDEHRHIPGIFAQQERTCEECERRFVIPRMDLWAYKLVVRGHTHWFCRYNCVRAGERKLKDKKAGRKTAMKSKRPSKEVLESDLRAGLSIAAIAKKYEGSVQSVHNWIKAYDLTGIQGQKKTKDEISEPTQPPGRSRAPMTSGVGIAFEGNPVNLGTPPVDDMVQHSTLSEIGQVHPNIEIQGFPQEDSAPWVDAAKVENLLTTSEATESTEASPDNPLPFTVNTDSVPDPKLCVFEEAWSDLRDDLATLRRLYVVQAEKSFNDRLHSLFLEVIG